MYTEYLQNMGVAASLTLSLQQKGRLWGLIACHHSTPIAFNYQVRTACELLAQIASLQLGLVTERESMQYRIDIEAVHHRLLAQTAKEQDISVILSGEVTLLDGIRAAGAAVCRKNRIFTAGITPTEEQIAQLTKWISGRFQSHPESQPVLVTDRLAAELPAAASYAAVASGVLAVPLARGGGSMILWFRPDVEQTVHWGGNPYESPAVTGPHGPRLTPRKSFEIWREVVRGRSEPWLDEEIDAAQKLRLLIMDLVIMHAEQLAEINEELQRSNDALDSFTYIASHDLKEPLRGMNKQAQHLIDEIKSGGALAQQALERSEALLRLTQRMDGLLDALMRFSRLGKLRLDLTEAPLSDVLQEAVDMLGALLLETNTTLKVPRPLPVAPCERVRVREVFANLINNAVKYSPGPDRWVEVGFVAPGEPPPPFLPSDSIPDAARGQTILYVRDGGIGIDPRHHEQVFRMFKRLHARDDHRGGSGVGLAIVKKLVEQHRGVVWVASSLGQGATFCFTLGGGESLE